MGTFVVKERRNFRGVRISEDEDSDEGDKEGIKFGDGDDDSTGKTRGDKSAVSIARGSSANEVLFNL